MSQERVTQRLENAGFLAAKMIGKDQIQGRSDLTLVFVVPMRVVPRSAGCDLFGSEAEQEEVLLASFFRHLDRRAIACPDGQRSVHHELHVAGTAGLIAGRGD